MFTKAYLSDINPFTAALWKGMIALIVSIIAMVVVEKPVLPQLPACWGLWAGHSLCGGAAAVLASCAILKIPSVSVSYISALDTVLLGILQYTLLKSIQPGHQNWVEVTGMALIVLGNAFRRLLQNMTLNCCHKKDDYEDMQNQK